LVHYCGRLVLSFLGTTKVFGRCITRLALEFVNFSNNHCLITIRRENRSCRRNPRLEEATPHRPGEYQFQCMREDEMQMCIPTLRQVFPNDELVEIPLKNKGANNTLYQSESSLKVDAESILSNQKVNQSFE